jgi:uncharacterized protein
MLRKYYHILIHKIVGIATKYPLRMILFTVAITIPTIFFVNQITIDTNLIKLLPSDNQSVKMTKELQDKVGDGGQFIVIFEGNNREKLIQAVEYTARKIKQFPEVRDAQYKYPIDFISKFKYALIPNDYLSNLYDVLLKKEAEANPFSDNIMDTNEDTTKVTHGQKENEQDMQILLQQYLNLPEYHQSKDGKIFGILIPTKDGFSKLGKIKELYNKIQVVTNEASSKFGVWNGITGNHRNKLIEYDNINNDLSVATIFSFVCIFIILILSFRSLGPVLAVIYPLVLGLLWSFAIVPITFGSLNLITSFLVIILYGLGIDFPIHLIKRFNIEIQNHSVEDALYISFSDTGKSVIVSALTTAAGFVIVVFSDFRGFFEYGVLSSLAIIMILLAMYVALPPIVYLLWKYDRLKKVVKADKKIFLPSKIITYSLLVLTVIGIVFTCKDLKFDYFLSNTSFSQSKDSEIGLINAKRDKVYSASMSPAAIYACPSLESLDSVNSILNTQKNIKGTFINRVRSIRDFAPNDKDFAERHELLIEMKELLQGSWTESLKDTNLKSLITDFMSWNIPDKAPKVDELPALISDNLMGVKNSGYFLTTVYPTLERKDGRVAMAFTKELNSLKIPNGVKGPVGETIIFSDVLTLVLGEAWWIIVFGQLLVFLVVIVIQKKWKDSLMMMIPLATGIFMTFGLFAIFGLKITFFNIVCIPALMGMGVDGGIHYINRWIYRKRDLQTVQNELFEPLYSAFLTVIFGYGGMIFSSHSGIKSMGLMSSIGMTLIMIANLVLLPGILRYLTKRKELKDV